MPRAEEVRREILALALGFFFCLFLVSGKNSSPYRFHELEQFFVSRDWFIGLPFCNIVGWRFGVSTLKNVMLFIALTCRLSTQGNSAGTEQPRQSMDPPATARCSAVDDGLFSVWALLAKAGHGEAHKCLKKARKNIQESLGKKCMCG